MHKLRIAIYAHKNNKIQHFHIKTKPAPLTLVLAAILVGWALVGCQPTTVESTPEPQTRQVSTPTVEASITPEPQPQFDGERALEHVVTQVEMGPRIPSSPGHDRIVSWIVEELEKAGWGVEIQESTQMEHPVKNIVARRGDGQPWILLGAHYDSRMVADQDPDPEKVTQPVPGANDGASGVAVLLELARAIPTDLPKQVWLVFFDAEDNGNIPGWNWILGSRAFVDQLDGKPDAVVIVDMIGDAGLDIYKEGNSDPEITEAIWKQAEVLGYDQFKPTIKHRMIDDHTPFLQAGIRAIDIIDFDYPYWHTSEDTPDKVSSESLDAVGETLLAWLSNP